MSAWDVDSDGETAINPPKATYLVEVVGGSDTKKDSNGQEVPRKDDNGCPMSMFNCKIIMDSNGRDTFRAYAFGIFIKHDERGSRMMRRMIKALMPEATGKVSVTTSTFNGKMAWVEGEFRGQFFNVNHDTWAKKDSLQIHTAARSSDVSSAKADEDLPF